MKERKRKMLSIFDSVLDSGLKKPVYITPQDNKKEKLIKITGNSINNSRRYK